MLKVAIVGCGKIADSHAVQIQRIRGCEIVGVCDREPLMARQLYERFPVKGHFSDLGTLLAEARPDVVHITTPPRSHFEIARQCLEAGAHVYVEKPFTLDEKEAEGLVALAGETGRKLTVGHDGQFSHVSRRMRSLVASGYLGGQPVHMESYYCYDLGDASYVRAFLGDGGHWVRALPGGLLQNIISHGVARIAEFMSGDGLTVVTHGFVSPFLRRLGEREIVDELRVILGDGAGTTAYFTVSTQMRPLLQQFRAYGPKNGLVLDQHHETLIKLRGASFKSYVEKFVPPVQLARQHLENVVGNIRKFIRSDFHMQAGMKCLIETFYDAIRHDGPVPIPYREILLTARIMDRILEQVAARATTARG
jgi:predicted dehydrogenase